MSSVSSSVEPSSGSPGPRRPSFAGWMGSLWLFTILRFALFFALWGLLYLVGVPGLFAALLAAVLSVPLSFVLLAGPRRRVAANMQARLDARNEAREDLDRRLDPDA